MLSAKSWAIKLATDAAVTILSVDQISALTCSVNFTQMKTTVRQTDDKERSGFTVNETDKRDVYFEHPAPCRRELCENFASSNST